MESRLNSMENPTQFRRDYAMCAVCQSIAAITYMWARHTLLKPKRLRLPEIHSTETFAPLQFSTFVINCVDVFAVIIVQKYLHTRVVHVLNFNHTHTHIPHIPNKGEIECFNLLCNSPLNRQEFENGIHEVVFPTPNKSIQFRFTNSNISFAILTPAKS